MGSKILKYKYLPILLLILNVILFFFILPTKFLAENGILFPITGGFIILLLSMWIFIIFFSDWYQKFPILGTVFSFVFFFIFTLTLANKAGNYINNQLENYGEYTKATVIKKTRLSIGKGKSTVKISVQFFTKNKTIQIAEISISKDKYKKLSENEEVVIHYSTENPSIARLTD